VSKENGSYCLSYEKKSAHHSYFILWIADKVQVNHPIVESNGRVFIDDIGFLLEASLFNRTTIVSLVQFIQAIDFWVKLKEWIHC
jgi:hypothetical protein